MSISNIFTFIENSFGHPMFISTPATSPSLKNSQNSYIVSFEKNVGDENQIKINSKAKDQKESYTNDCIRFK